MSPEAARAAAIRYVRGMLSRGYDTAAAAREAFMGYSAAGEPGWDIRSGKITVPCFGPNKHTFRFSELEAEIRRGESAAVEQMELAL